MKTLIARRWPELSPLLDQALALTVEQRPGWLAAMADPELRDALAHLLTSETTTGLLDRDGQELARTLIRSDPDSNEPPAAPCNWIGRRLGVWRVQSLLGEGGMASVFLADRDDGGFDQQVAIKVLRQGMLDPFEQQRFLRERQILARLEHPHIARLIDGGLTSEGIPWFALEYVEGSPITDYCDRHGLDIPARLRLFLDVCHVVDHAHQALVVHRDLKPSNVLVKHDGCLKLLDFGIARLIDSDDDALSRDHATVTTARRLTPAYAAPEQWSGEAVGTRTDVYALGVLLHALTTGRHPQRRDDGSLRVPSSLITHEGPDTAALAGLRGATPMSLRKRVGGDLDVIIATALQNDPARRYVSVSALADDIDRHLRQQPVQARPDSLAYRSGRFLRRNWLATGASGVLALSIAVGTAATWQQARHARAAASQAQLEAGRASAVKEFLLDVFAGAAPNQTQGEQITALELLDRSTHRLDEGMADTPQLRAELQLTLAGIYRELGQYPRATDLIEQARANASANPAALSLERGRLSFAQGLYDDAETALRSSLDSLDPDDTALHAETLSLLAETLAALDRKDEATTLIEHAIALDSAQAEQSLPLARDKAVLGHIAFGRGELEAAETALREALTLRIEQLGAVHTLVATTQHDLAVVILQRGQVDEAFELFGSALATRRTLLGADHADVAASLLNLGVAERRRGHREQAQQHFQGAVAILEQRFPDGHPELANGYNSLALLSLEQGDPATAIEQLGTAIGYARKSLGDQHATVGTMLGNLAAIQSRVGQHDDALVTQAESLATLSASLGEQHHLYGIALHGLARIHLAKGDHHTAIDDYRRAATVIAGSLGETHLDYGGILAGLADAYLAAGELALAKAQIERASTIISATAPPEHVRRIGATLIHADVLAASNDCAAALEMIQSLPETLPVNERERIRALRERCR